MLNLFLKHLIKTVVFSLCLFLFQGCSVLTRHVNDDYIELKKEDLIGKVYNFVIDVNLLNFHKSKELYITTGQIYIFDKKSKTIVKENSHLSSTVIPKGSKFKVCSVNDYGTTGCPLSIFANFIDKKGNILPGANGEVAPINVTELFNKTCQTQGEWVFQPNTRVIVEVNAS
jgi:hypothetical protein